MRIQIDATPLLLRSAGIKNYVYHWVESLRQAGGGHEITTFPCGGPLGPLNHEGSQFNLPRTAGGIARLQLLNRSGLAWHARCDIFHASQQLLNPPRGARLTTTLHDVTCRLMPELHTAGNVAYFRRFAERVLRRADGIIAVSECTRQDAIRLLGIHPDKIRTV